MLRIFIIMLSFITVIHSQDIKKGSPIQIGMYALQAPPGTKGFQNGSIKGIKSDIESVSGIVNAAVPYRHWDRVDYPDWDFNGYFLTYMEEMYDKTFDPATLACLQTFTPPMYSSFLDPPLKNMPEDDRWYNRSLDFDLFKIFIRNILEKEFELVKKAADNNDKKALKILSNSKLRPLGGWYLDDEPFVRNHDIEIIETMSSVIRLLEKEFFHEMLLPEFGSKLKLSDYLHPRYIAFDGDDLHKHPKSSRRFDGQFYNKNGRTIYFNENKIYSVFKKNVYDVILIDFYHNDILFWQKIIDQIQSEIENSDYDQLSVMPVFNGEISDENQLNSKLIEIENLLELFSRKNLPGYWIYIWDDPNSKKLGAKEIWNRRGTGLKQKIVNSRK